jgi:hypothetical protein
MTTFRGGKEFVGYREEAHQAREVRDFADRHNLTFSEAQRELTRRGLERERAEREAAFERLPEFFLGTMPPLNEDDRPDWDRLKKYIAPEDWKSFYGYWRFDQGLEDDAAWRESRKPEHRGAVAGRFRATLGLSD